MRVGAFLRDGRGTHQFWIEMSIGRAEWMNNLIGIIMCDDRHRFLFAIRSFEIVVRNRSDWLEYCRLLDDWWDRFGNHFGHLLLGYLRAGFTKHLLDLLF